MSLSMQLSCIACYTWLKCVCTAILYCLLNLVEMCLCGYLILPVVLNFKVEMCFCSAILYYMLYYTRLKFVVLFSYARRQCS